MKIEKTKILKWVSRQCDLLEIEQKDCDKYEGGSVEKINALGVIIGKTWAFQELMIFLMAQKETNLDEDGDDLMEENNQLDLAESLKGDCENEIEEGN